MNYTLSYVLRRSLPSIFKTELPIASNGVGSDKLAAARNSRAGLAPHCIVDETFQPKASTDDPKEEEPFSVIETIVKYPSL